MIKLKPILVEQFAKPNADLKLAKQIYDAKGLVWDDPYSVVSAIKKIKTLNQFNLVNRELMKLTAGRDIATYLKSFLDVSDKQIWIAILSYLKKQFPGNKEEILYPIGKVYFNLVNKSTDPTSGKIGSEFVSPNYIKWWKKHSANVVSGISTSALSTMGDVVYENRHEILQTLQLVSIFIPTYGLFISTGIGLVDATMYAQEGETYEAGISAVFALLPGMGKVVTKIPGVRILGSKGMAILGQKLATSKKPVLTWIERIVIKDMSKYKDVIKKDMDDYFKARAKQEAARLLKYQGKSKAGKLAMKIGDGSIKASRLGAQAYAALKTWDWAGAGAEKAWQKIYFDLTSLGQEEHNRKYNQTDWDTELSLRPG